ncbi:MAG: hypothetical protein LBH07_01740 [Treponema sp.]|jgi:hypothetical protein|nr:hypothetical protein [Treponema sp.]
MKRRIIVFGFITGLLIFSCFMVINTPPVFAQQQDQPRLQDRWGPSSTSELYYINIPIEKVYTHNLGYIIVYRKAGHDLGRAYVPYKWFNADSRKADLVLLGDGAMWPSMSVFYKEGAFYGVRLYVARRQSHSSWGFLSSMPNLTSNFEAETLELNF